MLPLPELLEECRARGVKLTPQRIAIFECLQHLAGHPSAEEVYRAVLRRSPGISFATVYNTLELLTRMGQVREVIVDELRRRYDVNTRPHQHAICRRCHRILDVPLDPEGPLAAALSGARLDEHGFLVESVAVEFRGLCAGCADREARA